MVRIWIRLSKDDTLNRDFITTKRTFEDIFFSLKNESPYFPPANTHSSNYNEGLAFDVLFDVYRFTHQNITSEEAKRAWHLGLEHQ